MSGGEFIERTNQFDFVAPSDGYISVLEWDFSKDMQKFPDSVAKTYFAKFSRGYARLGIYVGIKRPLLLSVDYDYNPDGSTNLEAKK